MTNIGPDRWKLVVSAGTDNDGHRRRVVRSYNGTRADAIQALAELASTTTTSREPPNVDTLLRQAMSLPDDRRAHLAAQLIASLK